jgi:hypothetical protein
MESKIYGEKWDEAKWQREVAIFKAGKAGDAGPRSISLNQVQEDGLVKRLEDSRRERDRVLAYCKASNDRLDIDVVGNAFVNVKEAEERLTVPNQYLFREEAEENRRAAKVAVDAMSRDESHKMTDLYGKGWKNRRKTGNLA